VKNLPVGPKPEDEKWMRRALEWSLRGRGLTSPRPSVGCVLVLDRRELSGAHTVPGNGQLHAETGAIAVAQAQGIDVCGATAYVTLEPCSHWGTTPPCCDALVREGIARVVCGVLDPDVRVAGRGFERLEQAGVEVVQGVLARECFRAMDDFLVFVSFGRPFVSLKLAMSLDGKIALPSGESRWITGEEARRRAHGLRRESDVILVGVETVIADDPALTVRLGPDVPPKTRPLTRVVLDSRGRTPLASTCIQTAREAPTIVATTGKAAPEFHCAMEAAGAQVLVCNEDEAGRVEWSDLLNRLGGLGIASVMVEGGAQVAGSLLRSGLADRVDAFVAPRFLGEGREAIAGLSLGSLAQAPALELVEHERCGDDVLVSGYVGQAARLARSLCGPAST
jgi:diaminohydroxyphosphoribosylaminopyrimidine deaminase/5-amino-6-(5-phosphoribosylamino)uracil reductase